MKKYLELKTVLITDVNILTKRKQFFHIRGKVSKKTYRTFLFLSATKNTTHLLIKQILNFVEYMKDYFLLLLVQVKATV